MNRREFAQASLAALLLPTSFDSKKTTLALPKPTPQYNSSSRTADIARFGNPRLFESVVPRSKTVMQDFVKASRDVYFITQAQPGTNGYEDVLVTRYHVSSGKSDSMRLHNAGHGIGIEVEVVGSVTWLIMVWRERSAATNDREFDLVRFRYRPGGTYTYLEAQLSLGLRRFVVNDPETLVHLDIANDWAVCKHYDNAGTDIYSRRRWSELKRGVDHIYNQIALPISTGTLQGFSTINNTLYRYMGKGVVGGIMDSSDPIAIESFDWKSCDRLSYTTYPTLGREKDGTWAGGKAEPEGMNVIREKDGTASLLVGLVMGMPQNRKWNVYKFASIGAAA